MRHTLTAIAVALASLLFTAVAFGLPPFSTAPKHAAGTGMQAEISHLRVGCHANFDRFVVRARFGQPEYDVRYVRRIIADGSGHTVHLLGKKRLRIVLQNSRAHSDQDGSALVPNVKTPLCPNLRQVKTAGDFEGVVTFGLGLRHKTGFRVFRLRHPKRLVVDVLH
jgi:hypothetical protein